MHTHVDNLMCMYIHVMSCTFFYIHTYLRLTIK